MIGKRRGNTESFVAWKQFKSLWSFPVSYFYTFPVYQVKSSSLKENRSKPRNHGAQPLNCVNAKQFPAPFSLSNPHSSSKSPQNELSSANYSSTSDRRRCSPIGGHFSPDSRHCPMFSLPTISQPRPIRPQRCSVRHELLLLQPLRSQGRLRRMRWARYTHPQ